MEPEPPKVRNICARVGMSKFIGPAQIDSSRAYLSKMAQYKKYCAWVVFSDNVKGVNFLDYWTSLV